MNKYPRENEIENKLQFRFAPCEFMPIERFNLSELDRSTPDIPKKRLLFRYGHVNRTSVVSPVCARTTLDRGISTSPPRIGRRRHPSSREGACGRRISFHTPPFFFVLLLLFADTFFFAALKEEVARFLLPAVVVDATTVDDDLASSIRRPSRSSRSYPRSTTADAISPPPRKAEAAATAEDDDSSSLPPPSPPIADGDRSRPIPILP